MARSNVSIYGCVSGSGATYRAGLKIFSSRTDRNGNKYFAFQFTDFATGRVAQGTISGGDSNVDCVRLHTGEPGTWDQSILVSREELPIREYDSLVKDWAYAGCPPEEIAQFIKTALGLSYEGPCYCSDETMGAECGKANVPKTTDKTLVRCAECLKMLNDADPAHTQTTVKADWRSGLKPETRAELERMNGHMQPQIQESGAWVVETASGESFVVPEDLVGAPDEIADESPDDGTISISFAQAEKVRDALAEYLPEGISSESEIESAEFHPSGYVCRMSAPGYMDCTDWEWHETEQEAADSLIENYSDESTDDSSDDSTDDSTNE